MFHLFRSFKSFKSISLLLITLLTVLQIPSTQQLTKCTDPTATFYDGYLEPFLYYANFNKTQVSYLKFKNPFSGIQNFASASITFWARFPITGNDNLFKRGRILECNNQFKLHLDLYTLVYNVTSYQTDSKGNYQTTTIENNLNVTSLLSNSNFALSQWTNYAFSIKAGKMRVFVNGTQVAEGTMNGTNLTNSSDYCTVGNSLDFKQPLSIQMRHLVLSNYGFNLNENIQARIRAVVLPNDPNMLAYFKFHKDYYSQETYFYNSTLGLTQQGLNIQMSPDIEQVCYCTQPSPSFLKVSSAFKLKQLDMKPFNASLDQNGATLNFTIFPQLLSSSSDLVILGLDKYADIVLSNSGQRLRVDIYNYNGVVQQSLVLDSFLFRFNFWTNYSVSILPSQVNFSVDGVLIQTLSHQVTLPQRNSIKLNIAQANSFALTFLLSQIIVNKESTVQSSRTVIFNRTFTQDLLLPTFQTLNTTTGTLNFEANSQLCSKDNLYNPSNYISGNMCKGNRLAAGFKNYTQTTGLSVNLRSAMSQMTIEMWVRDQSNITSKSTNTQVLLENTNDGKTIQTQISLVPGSNDTQRVFKVIPQTTAASGQNVAVSVISNYNNWVHLAIISNITQINFYVLNTRDGSISTNYGYSMGFTQITSNGGFVNTSIGSSLSGANKFLGVLRELRIFAVARTDPQISLSRYSSAYSNLGQNLAGIQSLIHAFRLDDGLDYQNLYDSMLTSPTTLVPRYFDEKSSNASSYTWDQDLDLIVCSDNYYYDGQCCKQIDLSQGTGVVDLNFTYSASKSRIQLGLVKGNAISQTNFNQLSLYADFKFISVGYNFDQVQLATKLKPLFTRIETQYFEVSSYLVDPLFFNLTVQATIYSSFQVQNTFSINRTISLLCPRFALVLNNQSLQFNDNYVVSNRTNHLVRIIATQNTSLCFNNYTGQSYSVAMSKVSWSQNQTAKYPTFASMFNTSANTYTIDQRFEVSGLSKTLITALFTYNNTMTVTYSMTLDYQDVYIENGFTSVQAISNQLISDPTTFSFSGAYLNPNPNQIYSLQYLVNCPSDIFTTQGQYASQCIFSGSYFYLDTSNTTNFNIRLSKKYLYEFIVSAQNTYIMKPVQVTLTYYMDGSSMNNCPSVLYQTNYLFDKVNDLSFEMNPQAYLYCNGLFYEYQSSTWVVTDQVSKKVYNNVLNFTADQPLSIYLRSDNPNVQSITSGSVLVLNGTFQTKVANQTSYTGATRNISNQNGLVTFKVAQLVPKIITTTFAKSSVNNGQIGFLEPNVTMNASPSYDPDNSSAVLWYSWSCPPQIYNCTFSLFGQRNNSFIIDYWFRFRNSLSYNQNYTFTVTVWSKDNTFKVPQQLSYNVSFLAPQSTDINYAMTNTSCESLDFDQSTYIAQTTNNNRVIWISRANYTQVFFNIISKIDSGTLALKSPCGFGNVTNQLILAYFGFNLEP